MNITRTIFYKGFAVLAITLFSCTDLLDLQPQTAFSDATAFDTPDRVALAVQGVYDAAQSGVYFGAVRGYPFGAAHIQQGDNRGEDVVNIAAFYQITYQSTYTPATANNDAYWINLFRLINRANVVLDGLEKVVPTAILTQALIDSYKGECRFLRALAYHELLKFFAKPYSDNPTAPNGGMPIRTTGITAASSAAAAATAGRNTVEETYQFILSDLNFAESVLPENRANVGLKISRATRAAAIALKTRVYLHMGRWADVVTEGNKIAPQAAAPFSAPFGGYNLPSNPFSAFSAAGSKNNTESIFSIEHTAEDNAGVNGGLASMYNTNQPPINGRGLVGISPLLWNQPWFLASDARKSDTFVFNAQPPGGTAKGARFTRKYTDVAGLSDNAPIIRYAEVLLNMAEAIQRSAGATPSPRAFAMFNAVRARSVSDPATNDITDFADGNSLIQAILNERRIEFVCEGLRWGDVHRLAQDATFNSWGGGIPAKVSTLLTNFSIYYTGNIATNTTILTTASLRHAAIPYSDTRFLWPIPNSELVLNPVLAAQQNPGW
jgi:hypothetical protein